MVVFQKYGENGIKRKPGGVGPDPFEHTLWSMLDHGENRRRDLRHRLDTEAVFRIAETERCAVGERHAQAEKLRVDIGQIRDIAGVSTPLDIFRLGVCLRGGLLDLSESNLSFHSQQLICLVERKRGRRPVSFPDMPSAALTFIRHSRAGARNRGFALLTCMIERLAYEWNVLLHRDAGRGRVFKSVKLCNGGFDVVEQLVAHVAAEALLA